MNSFNADASITTASGIAVVYRDVGETPSICCEERLGDARHTYLDQRCEQKENVCSLGELFVEKLWQECDQVVFGGGDAVVDEFRLFVFRRIVQVNESLLWWWRLGAAEVGHMKTQINNQAIKIFVLCQL